MAKIIQSFIADVNGDGVLDFIVVDSDHIKAGTVRAGFPKQANP